MMSPSSVRRFGFGHLGVFCAGAPGSSVPPSRSPAPPRRRMILGTAGAYRWGVAESRIMRGSLTWSCLPSTQQMLRWTAIRP